MKMVIAFNHAVAHIVGFYLTRMELHLRQVILLTIIFYKGEELP